MATLVTTRTKPLISALEIWQTNKNSSLELANAYYGDKATFFKDSLNVRFESGEGLPGAVLEHKNAQLWSDLGNQSNFRRKDMANAAGINAAIGIPVMPKEKVEAVILLLLSLQPAQKAAIELWQPNELGVLRISSSFYQNLSNFAQASKDYRFSVLEGLPSEVFDTRKAKLSPLQKEQGFIRSREAHEAQLYNALGLPILIADEAKGALLFLHDDQNPWATVKEIWQLDKGKLTLEQGFYGQNEGFKELSASLSFETKEDIAAQVANTKKVVLHDLQRPESSFARSQSAKKAGFRFVLGIPLFHKGKVKSVVVFFA